ncbi:hypothetical protein RF11_11520 [Thelohanellus kitauei]|uniref:Uncharacterized protein n=1 Tax=Thelohanellus kitauei TaxID=669202 RepID=A0A0C2J0R4_THEKT|nr:hypothetical protein RF11_11520 [Thelohanellus kitauei]
MQYYKSQEGKYEDLAWRLKKTKQNLAEENSMLAELLTENGSCVRFVARQDGYEDLKQEGWNHLTVNHSYNFTDPFIGAHTQILKIYGDKSKDLYQTPTLGRMEKPSIAFLVLLKHAANLYPPPK